MAAVNTNGHNNDDILGEDKTSVVKWKRIVGAGGPTPK